MKVSNDYTTLTNEFEEFDREYQLYMLNILLEYMTSYGKNKIERQDVYKAISILKNEFKIQQPKIKRLVKVA